MFKQSTVFERHPKKSLIVIFTIGLLVLDLIFTATLKSLGFFQEKYDTASESEAHYRKQHHVFHHTLAPNIHWQHAIWGGIEYEIYTNSLGFKDSSVRQIEIEIDRKKVRRRLLFIGDSFTEGQGVEYSSTFVGILAEHYAQQGIEIFNAAVASYSPVIYYRKIKYLLENENLQFDQLVVCIDLSDVIDESLYYILSPKDGSVISRKKENIIEEESHIPRNFKDILDEYSMIARSLRRLARLVRNVTKPYEKSLNRKRSMWTILEDRDAETGLQLAAKHMSALKSILDSRQIPLVIVVYPWPDQIINNDFPSKQTKFWERWSIENQVEYIDLFPSFVGVQNPQDVIEYNYIPGDVHWNKNGHKQVAEQLILQFGNI